MRLLHRWAARGAGALAVCAALGAAACGGGGGDAGGGGAAEEAPPGGYKTFGGGPPGGTLIVLWDREPDNLNPLTFDASPSYNLVHLMFRALARRDSTLSNYVPDLLESWQVNGNTVVMKVRPGLKWHDEKPVTADDVVFTIERQKDENVGSPRKPDVEGVESVRMVDSMTVEARLSRMSPAAVNALLEVIPVPKHILKDVAPAQMRFHAFGRQPVGNGLYRFGSWEQGRQVTVNANTTALGGRPSIDRIIVRNVPEPSARLTSLLNGEGDLTKVSADQKGRVESSQAVKLHHTPRVRPGWIAWNVDKEPVSDIRVRQAFLMSINRPALVEGLLRGAGEPALSPIPPALREHSRDVRTIPYDVAGAGRLLDAAGWRDTNGDGIRDKGGRPLNLEIEFSSSDPMRPDMLVGMQSQAKQAGINLVLKPMESTTWVSRLRARQFTGSFWGWGWGPGVMAPNAEAIWHSRSIPPGGANFAGYKNPRVDALIDSLLVEADTTRARAMWRTLEQTAIDDAVYAPIFLDPEFYGVSARFSNVKFRGPEWWEDVIFWSIPTNRRTARDRMAAQVK
ncbi:MAG TPA: ABC transporter substrate-binding protein [Longimicrobium sp.]|jgi:peptide/nickel transport system substrate-binding protein